MSLYSEIGILRFILSRKSIWYIEVTCPDIELFQEIGERAKDYASKRLPKICTYFLYRRFMKWRKEDNFRDPNRGLYHAFLDSLAWELGLKALGGRDRDLYAECVNMTVKFM